MTRSIADKINWPTVSVIIAALNAENTINRCLQSVFACDYPATQLEVIIIDNGSADSTKAIAERYPVLLLEERDVRGPGAARNRGIEIARGEILAFTDADCRVDSQWIKEGVRSMIVKEADLSGGKVSFTFSNKRTVAEFADSARAMNNHHYVTNLGAAVTANLFVKAKVVENIGFFPVRIKAGEDISWTLKATSAGFCLIFTPEAIVYHPARTLCSLLKKSFRVASGSISVHRQQGKGIIEAAAKMIQFVLPPSARSIKRLINSSQGMQEKRVLRIWSIIYLCNLLQVLGVITGIRLRRDILTFMRNGQID